MYNTVVIPPRLAGSVALFLLVAGCSATVGSPGSPADGGTARPTGTDGGTDRPMGSDLGVDVGDVPVSPWQVEFGDGATKLRAVWGSGPSAGGFGNPPRVPITMCAVGEI
jgi:hypothetical protein